MISSPMSTIHNTCVKCVTVADLLTISICQYGMVHHVQARLNRSGSTLGMPGTEHGVNLELGESLACVLAGQRIE